jgi:hypothetical protein
MKLVEDPGPYNHIPGHFTLAAEKRGKKQESL